MKICRLILAMFLLFILSGQVLANETSSQIARLKNVSGRVDIIRSGIVNQAVPGDYLLMSDKLKTQTGTVGIIFTDGTLLSIGPDSEIDINDYVFEPNNKKYAFELFMKKRTAMYSSGKLGKIAPESVNLKTPRATVGIRGTRLILEVR
jgi:hypothetical protein